MKRRKYGVDVYLFSSLGIPAYLYTIFELLKRFHTDPHSIDPLMLTTLLTMLTKGISDAYQSLRLQWQTNNAHQRVNQMQENNCKDTIAPLA